TGARSARPIQNSRSLPTGEILPRLLCTCFLSGRAIVHAVCLAEKRREPPFGGSLCARLGAGTALSQLVHSGSGLPTKQTATHRHEHESEQYERTRVVGFRGGRRQALLARPAWRALEAERRGTTRGPARPGRGGRSGRTACARARGPA